MFRENALKTRLAAGKKALGCWCFTDNNISAEILGHAAYDFVLIDHEHGFGNPAAAVGQMQALQAFPATVLVRVAENDPVPIKRALDIGAEGVMVPMIETAAEAAAAVAACRYPPAGIRGCANAVVRAADYGIRAADYLAQANDQVFVMLQIESRKAIDNIAEIAAVAGVDVLFMGPSDLAASTGHPGDFDNPAVKSAIEDCVAAVKAAGKPLGAVPHSGLGWRELFAAGYDIVAAGSDISLLRTAAMEQVAIHREDNS